VSSFMQRMGRTGRRSGTTANTTFFCEDPEAVVQAVALIELAREGWVENVPEAERCWPVLVHQLLAMTLQFGAISAERCWEQLSRVPDFRGIARQEFDAVVEHMKKEDFLFESGGLLSMGQKAERAFGKKNFKELYAVFSSPVLYRVVTAAGRDLGSLEQNFVDRLVEDMSSFLLGGRAWTVARVNHEERVVQVREAPGGVKPSWGGFVPQFLGHELCQRIRKVLIETTKYPYVDEPGYAHLQAKREDLGELLKRQGHAVQLDGSLGRWWTFAGGRINHTLKYAFEVSEGWRSSPTTSSSGSKATVWDTSPYAKSSVEWRAPSSGPLPRYGRLSFPASLGTGSRSFKTVCRSCSPWRSSRGTSSMWTAPSGGSGLFDRLRVVCEVGVDSLPRCFV